MPAAKPKLNMRVSLVNHIPFDDDELAAAAANMERALRAQNLPDDEIQRRVAAVFPPAR